MQKRGRHHEELVNTFAEWLSHHKFQPMRNDAIDLGLTSPPVLIEAKMFLAGNRGSQTKAVRQAVGQLFEYRHFQAVDKESKLLFLASSAVDRDFVEYLEQIHSIGVIWKDGDQFRLTSLARAAFAPD